MQTSGASRRETADACLMIASALRFLWSEVMTHYRLRHSGMRRQAQARNLEIPGSMLRIAPE
jgi:hypothetical protein